MNKKQHSNNLLVNRAYISPQWLTTPDISIFQNKKARHRILLNFPAMKWLNNFTAPRRDIIIFLNLIRKKRERWPSTAVVPLPERNTYSRGVNLGARSFRQLGGAPKVWPTRGHPGSNRPRVRAGAYLEVATLRYDHPLLKPVIGVFSMQTPASEMATEGWQFATPRQIPPVNPR